MLIRTLAVVLVSVGSLIAQSTTISINDNKGNQAVGTITNGNVYFHDSNGNIVFGTIRDGNVFLSTDKGEITFGTIKNGAVSLTDQKGLTTGTINNGNIFLNNSDGSVTTGTYNNSGSVTTTTNTTPTPTSTAQQQEESEQLQQTIRQNNADEFKAGFTIGSALGNGIISAVERHKLTAFCNAHPTAVYQTNDRTETPCQDAPISVAAQNSVNTICLNHPYATVRVGLRIITCDKPPEPPNLAWITWAMDAFSHGYKAAIKNKDAEKISETINDFNEAADMYCKLTGVGAAYNDFQGNEQHCK